MLVILYFIIAGRDTTTALRKTFGLVKLQGSPVQQTTMIHMLLHKKKRNISQQTTAESNMTDGHNISQNVLLLKEQQTLIRISE